MTNTNDLTWNDVLEVHKDRRGVYCFSGSVSSVIFSSTGSHGDVQTQDEIVYVLPVRKSYRIDRAAMRRAHETQSTFTVFQKLAVNKYRNLGRHVVTTVTDQPGKTLFHITPVASNQPP